MPKATFDNRQEYTDAKGKVFHDTQVDDAGVPGGRTDVQHVGPWLLCDTCNPVWPIDGSKDDTLAGLRIEYDAAKAAAASATERLEAVKAKLKVRMAVEGATRTELQVPGYRPLTLTYSEKWTLDSKAIKAEQPLIYVQYAKQGSSWTLAEAKGDPT